MLCLQVGPLGQLDFSGTLSTSKVEFNASATVDIFFLQFDVKVGLLASLSTGSLEAMLHSTASIPLIGSLEIYGRRVHTFRQGVGLRGCCTYHVERSNEVSRRRWRKSGAKFVCVKLELERTPERG